MGWFNIFGKESNTTTSSTSNYNDSRTFSENTSTNTSNNTSNSVSTNTNTDINNTSTQDRRLVNDRGIGVSADNSTVWTADSNNTTTSNWTQDASLRLTDDHTFNQANDSHNIFNTVSDFGAVSGGLGIAATALGANSGVFNTAAGVLTRSISSQENSFLHQLDAGNFLASQGIDMLKANISFAEHLSDSNQALQANAISQIRDASTNAVSQVAAIAAKPLNAQDPQHIIVIVGLVVVGVMALRGFK